MPNIFRRKQDTARERERADRRTDRAVSHSCLALAVFHEPQKPNGTGTAIQNGGSDSPSHFCKLYQTRLRLRFKGTACVFEHNCQRESNGGQQLAQTERSLPLK